jgi:phage baseplate assembly protein W
MSGYSWSLPLPPAGTLGGSAGPGDEVDRFFGRDIWYDVAAAHGPNSVVNRRGDWLVVSGVEALRQSLIRRFITDPGEWRTKPDYGAGARRFVKKRNDAAARAQLANRLRAQALRDRRVASVEAVVVEPGAGGVLRIMVRVIPKGAPARAIPIAIELR